MRYRVEFLREATEEESVCFVRSLRAKELNVVQLQAHAWAGAAQRNFGAGGFQIRDLDNDGLIVALEEFEGPPPTIH